jgi:hypothetical protein
VHLKDVRGFQVDDLVDLNDDDDDEMDMSDDEILGKSNKRIKIDKTKKKVGEKK